MGDFFGGLRSGIQFPQVVMNQGPLPSGNGLPQPLHETADARINYNSSLLGDITPYAYGEPGYLSSQNAYLNIPHKIQKIVPVVFLPEAKVGARDFFDLSHPIDDGDLAFVLRLDRSSLFCTGLKNGDMRRAGLGTAIDPLINLPTLNYILSGMQLGVTHRPGDLWMELLYNLDPHRFAKSVGLESRNYDSEPIGLADVIHLVHNCIRPFGITRGSEKQGGQDEATLGAATWPVSFVVSLTIDGKESNVVNLWHNQDLHAGNDLVLRLKLMPLRPYTLNHYYKGVKRQTWTFPDPSSAQKYVWQLVPDILHLDMPSEKEQKLLQVQLASLPPSLRQFKGYRDGKLHKWDANADTPWQDYGYWHVGRSQIMTGRYGVEEYWHNDLANALRTNHLDITFQPSFCNTPFMRQHSPGDERKQEFRLGVGRSRPFRSDWLGDSAQIVWTPALGLEKLHAASEAQAAEMDGIGGTEVAWDADLGIGTGPVTNAEGGAEKGEEWLGRLEFTDDAGVSPESSSVKQNEPEFLNGGSTGRKSSQVGTSNGGVTTGKPAKRGRIAGGSLLKSDGSSEISSVEML